MTEAEPDVFYLIREPVGGLEHGVAQKAFVPDGASVFTDEAEFEKALQVAQAKAAEEGEAFLAELEEMAAAADGDDDDDTKPEPEPATPTPPGRPTTSPPTRTPTRTPTQTRPNQPPNANRTRRQQMLDARRNQDDA